MATFISNAIGNDKACKTLEWSVKTGALNLAETRLMFNIKGRPGQPSEVRHQALHTLGRCLSSSLVIMRVTEKYIFLCIFLLQVGFGFRSRVFDKFCLASIGSVMMPEVDGMIKLK